MIAGAGVPRPGRRVTATIGAHLRWFDWVIADRAGRSARSAGFDAGGLIRHVLRLAVGGRLSQGPRAAAPRARGRGPGKGFSA